MRSAPGELCKTRARSSPPTSLPMPAAAAKLVDRYVALHLDRKSDGVVFESEAADSLKKQLPKELQGDVDSVRLARVVGCCASAVYEAQGGEGSSLETEEPTRTSATDVTHAGTQTTRRHLDDT